MAGSKGHGFGTAPVFLAAISTILGAVLFLRFGYAVGHVGFAGTIAIILIGHAITIPTALAIAEIATNLKVEGGGEYFIISRSFGTIVGGTIGISLYISQAISVAFYMIAFAEAFTPFLPDIQQFTGVTVQTWHISVTATVLLLILILTRGASIGVTTLWIVAGILAVVLISFFLGGIRGFSSDIDVFQTIKDPDSFYIVFAIIFPAFTGMTAGVGLSGDLKRPRKSIPLGTLTATFTGMVVYIFVVLIYAGNLSPEDLTANQFAMGKVALWGPAIPIGLAAATLSSAIGSILVAPRTLQAIGKDGILPFSRLNNFIARGKSETNEPVMATLLTALIIVIFVSMGSIDIVAKIISMFFMITYGALCSVSFLEHFAGNPSYRPVFRSRWYLSLIGAVASLIMMFQMSTMYAFLALLMMLIIYFSIKKGREDQNDLSAMLRGVLYQLTRKLQILIQHRKADKRLGNWRPSFIGISSDTFSRLSPFDLMRWLAHYYGFGSYIHFIKGRLDKETKAESEKVLKKLIETGTSSDAKLYVDTIISPSFKTAVAQLVQIPGISGMENNSILFEFQKNDNSSIPDIIEGCDFAELSGYNICILRSSDRHFGYRKKLDIWLTPGDYRNANLMILLAYILKAHPDWKECEINLYVAFEQSKIEKEVLHLKRLIEKGRIPIAYHNVTKVPWNHRKTSYEKMVSDHSAEADLVIMGFSVDRAEKEKGDFFKRFPNISDLLFVRAGESIVIGDTET